MRRELIIPILLIYYMAPSMIGSFPLQSFEQAHHHAVSKLKGKLLTLN